MTIVSRHRVFVPPWAGRLLVLALRLLLGAILLISGLGKLRQPYDFLINVYAYQVLGPPWGRYLAIILPHVEIVTGACLLTGSLVLGASASATFLMLVFAAAQAWVLYRSLVIPCGCPGAGDRGVVTTVTLARTIAFGVIAAITFAHSAIRQRAVARQGPGG